jgi:outer membrane protein OmpA-like peptidoglycan-associated protein
MLQFNTSFAKNGKITDESDLSRLVNLLKEKENLVVEITAFADASTPAKKQKAEAMKRANAVRSYLVKNKIPGNRVVVGKGMSSGKIEAKVVRVLEPKAPKGKGKKGK